MRQARLQMEASEAEVNHLRKEIGEQGKRLADIHANLIEKEIQFNQAKAKLVQQQELMKKIRETADETIKRLNAQLAQAKEMIQAKKSNQ
jgi:predicted trehalose synthase